VLFRPPSRAGRFGRNSRSSPLTCFFSCLFFGAVASSGVGPPPLGPGWFVLGFEGRTAFFNDVPLSFATSLSAFGAEFVSHCYRLPDPPFWTNPSVPLTRLPPQSAKDSEKQLPPLVFPFPRQRIFTSTPSSLLTRAPD